MSAVSVNRRMFIGGICAMGFYASKPVIGQQGPMRWSTQDQLEFAEYVPSFASAYTDEVDCANLAIDSLITFAAKQNLPVRLFDFDGPNRTKRWLTYDPRRDDWKAKRAFMMQQLGAINLIENSRKIRLSEVRSGDLILHKNLNGGGYTGHTRLLISARYDAAQKDYSVVRYEGNLPPVVPVLKQGWFKELDNVVEGAPRRWNFGQFSMA